MKKIIYAVLLNTAVFFMLIGVCFSEKPIGEKYILRERVIQQSKKAGGLIEEAVSYQKKGDYTRAIDILRKAAQMIPYDPRPYVMLIKIYSKLNLKDEVLLTIADAGNYYTDLNEIFSNLGFMEENLDLSLPGEFAREGIYIAPFKDNKKSAVSFMFDDGPLSVYEEALPIFDKYVFKATIPINPGIVPTDKTRNPWWGTWSEWQDAHRRGFEIANHSLNHVLLTDLSDEELDRQVNQGYEMIKQKIGKAPLSFVFPYDKMDARVIKKVTEKHLFFREYHFLSFLYPNSMIVKYGGPHLSVETANDVMNFALRNNFWIISQCHAIETKEKFKTYKPLSKDFLDRHLAYIKSKQDIWVDTFANVALYLKQRKLSKLIIHDRNDNSIALSVRNLDPAHILPVKLTVVIPKPKKDFTRVSAWSISNKEKPIPVKTKDSLWLLDIYPNGIPVIIKWE